MITAQMKPTAVNDRRGGRPGRVGPRCVPRQLPRGWLPLRQLMKGAELEPSTLLPPDPLGLAYGRG